MTNSLYAALRARCGQPIDAISRRRFVQESLSAAGLLLLSAGDGMAARRAADVRPRVVVVGAGFAGLACAFELLAAGYEVVLLEARDRLGGRVRTLSQFVAGKTVEAGGEFVGSNHPTWLAYAERFKLSLVEIPETHDVNSPVVLEGKKLSKISVIALFQQIEEVYEKITDAARPIDADAPWNSPDAEALDRLSTGTWLDRLELRPLVRRALEAEFLSYGGVPTERESFLGFLAVVKGGGLEKYWTENEAFHCTGGNQQLAQRLAEKIGADQIHLRAPVERIAVTDRGVKVSTATGQAFEADDVVLTVPPSTWKNIRFDPPLPTELKPQMGLNSKYILAVREAFWTQAGLPPTSMSDSVVGFTWCATEGQPGSPEQALVAFIGGPATERLHNATPEVRDRLVKNDLSERYPDWQNTFVKAQFVDWPGDKWTLGSYATPAPGEVMSQSRLLDAGIGRLHFAGEHTCLKFIGFMEGALHSGVRVARRLAVRDSRAS